MKKEEKLYEVLGELLYTIAIADGVIQPEERNALKGLFKDHEYRDHILWSFEYEEGKNASVEEVYNKVINYCHRYGSTPIYTEFIEAMKVIAKAAEGIDPKESEIINSFSTDLMKRFEKDVAALLNYERDERD